MRMDRKKEKWVVQITRKNNSDLLNTMKCTIITCSPFGSYGSTSLESQLFYSTFDEPQLFFLLIA